jgi:hypothetical protein
MTNEFLGLIIKRTYYLLPKPRGQRTTGKVTVVIKTDGKSIINAPDRTLLVADRFETTSILLYRFRGYWLSINKIGDFPSDTPKQILGIYTLLKGT